jgi:hypothetical protein
MTLFLRQGPTTVGSQRYEVSFAPPARADVVFR